MIEIEDSYMNMLQVLTMNKSLDQNKSQDIQENYLKKFQMLIDAYEDVKDYRSHYLMEY